jgi:hypothetical protein
MVRKFNEFVNERGFYYGHDEEMPGEDRFEEEMPMDMQDEMPMDTMMAADYVKAPKVLETDEA